MLFVLGVIFIIVTLGIVVYNRPKGTTAIEAILESTEHLNVSKEKKYHTEKIKSLSKKKKKKKEEDPAVVIGDDCSESLECPEPRDGVGQKNEQRCRAIFEKIYGKPFPSVRPKWLKNPATKRNLEFDMYCHKLEFTNNRGAFKRARIAGEYNGQQHYKMTQFHGSKKELLYQMKRDAYKTKKAKELGITVIPIPYWAKSDLEGYIIRKLDEVGLIPKEFSSLKLLEK